MELATRQYIGELRNWRPLESAVELPASIQRRQHRIGVSHTLPTPLWFAQAFHRESATDCHQPKASHQTQPPGSPDGRHTKPGLGILRRQRTAAAMRHHLGVDPGMCQGQFTAPLRIRCTASSNPAWQVFWRQRPVPSLQPERGARHGGGHTRWPQRKYSPVCRSAGQSQSFAHPAWYCAAAAGSAPIRPGSAVGNRH